MGFIWGNGQRPLDSSIKITHKKVWETARAHLPQELEERQRLEAEQKAENEQRARDAEEAKAKQEAEREAALQAAREKAEAEVSALSLPSHVTAHGR